MSLKKPVCFILVLAMITMSSITRFTFSDPLTIQTDKEVYSPGETVEVSGSALANTSLNLLVNVSEEIIFNITVEADEDGEFEASFELPSNSSIGTYIITINTDGTSATAEFTVEDQDCELASNLQDLVENARGKAQDILDELQEDGKVSEGVTEALEEANATLNEALNLMDEGECQSAAKKATEALQLYGRAIRMMLDIELEPEEKEFEEEAEKFIGLQVAIDRAYDFLDKVNETATRFEDEEGYNVTDVRDRLLVANITLNQAEANLTDGNFTEAVELKASARKMLGQTMGLLHSMNKGNKAEKAAKFLEKAEERLKRTEERLNNKLQNLPIPAHAKAAAGRGLQNARNRLRAIRGMIQAGDIEDAIKGFGRAKAEEERGMEALEESNPGVTNNLRALERLMAKIALLEERMEELDEEGVETPDINDTLQTIKNKLDEAEGYLEDGDTEAAEEALDEADELIDELEELLEQFEEEAEDQEEEDGEKSVGKEKREKAWERGKGRSKDKGKKGNHKEKEDD